jgi:programmed cell death protein 4
MNLLLMEYLSSGDKDEAIRCLREPHFNHELVYEAIVMVLEKADKQVADMLCSLLQHMAHVTVLTTDQINKVYRGRSSLRSRWLTFFSCCFLQGFMRVFHDMTDIVLDVPNAYHTLSKFVESGAAAGFVSRAIAEEIPSR